MVHKAIRGVCPYKELQLNGFLIAGLLGIVHTLAWM